MFFFVATSHRKDLPGCWGKLHDFNTNIQNVQGRHGIYLFFVTFFLFSVKSLGRRLEATAHRDWHYALLACSPQETGTFQVRMQAVQGEGPRDRGEVGHVKMHFVKGGSSWFAFW